MPTRMACQKRFEQHVENARFMAGGLIFSKGTSLELGVRQMQRCDDLRRGARTSINGGVYHASDIVCGLPCEEQAVANRCSQLNSRVAFVDRGRTAKGVLMTTSVWIKSCIS